MFADGAAAEDEQRRFYRRGELVSAVACVGGLCYPMPVNKREGVYYGRFYRKR